MGKLKLYLLSTVLFFFVAQGAFADIDANLKKTFDVNKGGTLNIESDFGSIEVSTHQKNSVVVEILREVDAFTKKEAERILEDLEISFDQQGNDVYVEADYHKDGFRWGNRRIKMKFIVTVPDEYNVDLSTSGGSISVDDLKGAVAAKTSGGSLSFGNIEGPVNGRTSGGSISLDGCDGNADIKTSGGSIKIGDVNGSVDAHTSGGSIKINRAEGNVIAKTSGGSISVEEVLGEIEAKTSGGSVTARILSQPKADCTLSTSGGSVNIYMANNVDVNVDAKTSGGRVKTEFPVTIKGEIKKNELKAKINEGGPLLYLRTSGGNITLKEL